ncbi:hypothetical protein PH505_be00380 [Pseudoalteromonas distincta]|uniref:hypothetical protein n=1 Tax=Pseudoalteromonas distincta TaxID=77608 RepID=UPI00020A084D|nr:hypothetical protein [Pseudoalteromonas distincta]EGI72763.1 hypothetical protein PH505_be00380 [Pseudoalteromonas distincta]
MSNVLKNKRKALIPSKELVTPKAQVEPLNVDGMVIIVPGYDTCHFKRFRYKGCPPLTTRGEIRKDIELIDMGRDNFIRDLYHLLNTNSNVTTSSHFRSVIKYIEWFDSNERKPIASDYFHWELINDYMGWCAAQHKLGLMNKEAWRFRKKTISWVLRKKGRVSEAKNLPRIKGHSPTNPYRAFDLESEFKPVVRALFKAFNVLIKHYNNDTVPDRHPLYDEEKVNEEAKRRDLKGTALGVHRAAFKLAMKKGNPNNHLTKVAILICYMFTGINSKPLADLKISDVSFKEVQGGKYILDSEKGRAFYQEQDNALGFSKYAKEFIEKWLSVAIKMSNGNKSAPLFPYFTLDDSVNFFSKVQIDPQRSVNRLLDKLGLSKVNPSRFRKTKMDTIFRVTESVYLVSISANNSLNMVARTYANGTEAEHENNLGASMDAKFAIAKGLDIDSAVQHAKFKFGDVLDDYEYQRLREGKDRSHESRTPTGIRCNNNTKGAAQVIRKLLDRVGVETSDNETVCTDFLDCFECEHHALVADVTDIWLMLSFKETLQQLQQTPAINSMPETKYIKLFNTVESILERFKEKSKKNYKHAKEKLKEAAHPLYSNVYSLNDLLEVFS